MVFSLFFSQPSSSERHPFVIIFVTVKSSKFLSRARSLIKNFGFEKNTRNSTSEANKFFSVSKFVKCGRFYKKVM